MVVGFMFQGGALGESVIGMESFYALKKVYDCKLIVFTSKIMQNLLQYCDFVDAALNEDIDVINAHHCDYLLLSKSDTYIIRRALQTNAKRIICATKILSFLSYRCKSVPIYSFKRYYHLDERQILLAYVRRINEKLYDTKIQHIDLSEAKVKTTKAHKTKAHNALLHAIETQQNPYFIAINPFNNACPYSLSMQGFLELIQKVANIPDCIPCVATYPAVHASFSAEWEAFITAQNDSALTKTIIFENDNDLLNLAAFIESMNCVISPSTGAIHLACNLRIPTIALYPHYDTRRWATHSRRYVFLDTPKNAITKEEEKIVINQTINSLHDMIAKGEIQPYKAT